jgi:hypothetical protein
MFVCCECCVLSGRGLCDKLITRPEEFCRLWCVVVCDLETSRMRKPWPTWGRSATAKNYEWRALRFQWVPIRTVAVHVITPYFCYVVANIPCMCMVKHPSNPPANALCSTELLVSPANRNTECHVWPDQHMNQNHKYWSYKSHQFFKDIETSEKFEHGRGECSSFTSRKGNVTRCCGL